jgi:hypothetical protein
MIGKICACSLLIPALMAGCQSGAEETAWVPPPLADQDAIPSDGREVLDRHVDFLESQDELAVEAFVTYEAVQESGQKLQFNLLQRIALRKPDKLYWRTLRDDATVDTAWFSNGRFTMLKAPDDVWGQVDGPEKISEMVLFLAEEYEVDVPFQDLLAGNARDLWLSEEVTSVTYVGEAWVEGDWTDHVAIRKPGVDIQFWVRKGPDPFLNQLVVVFTEEEGQPQYSARFRKWATTVPDAELFEVSLPEGAEKIEVVPVSD